MGEQIKVMEMARHLIRMAGYIPDVDIAIRTVGLRPGEKLREELVAMDEALTASPVDKIQRVQSGWVPELEFLQQKIDELERMANNGQCRSAVDLLCQLVPTFRPINVEAANPVSRRVRNRLHKLHVAGQSV